MSRRQELPFGAVVMMAALVSALLSGSSAVTAQVPSRCDEEYADTSEEQSGLANDWLSTQIEYYKDHPIKANELGPYQAASWLGRAIFSLDWAFETKVLNIYQVDLETDQFGKFIENLWETPINANAPDINFTWGVSGEIGASGEIRLDSETNYDFVITPMGWDEPYTALCNPLTLWDEAQPSAAIEKIYFVTDYELPDLPDLPDLKPLKVLTNDFEWPG